MEVRGTDRKRLHSTWAPNLSFGKKRPDQVVMVEAWKVGQGPTSRKVQRPVHLIRGNISLSSFLPQVRGLIVFRSKPVPRQLPLSKDFSRSLASPLLNPPIHSSKKKVRSIFFLFVPQPDRHTHCSHLWPYHGRENHHSGRFIQQSSFNDQNPFLVFLPCFSFGGEILLCLSLKPPVVASPHSPANPLQGGLNSISRSYELRGTANALGHLPTSLGKNRSLAQTPESDLKSNHLTHQRMGVNRQVRNQSPKRSTSWRLRLRLDAPSRLKDPGRLQL